jgi:hypothetical protein
MPVPIRGPVNDDWFAIQDPRWATLACMGLGVFGAAAIAHGIAMLLEDLRGRRWTAVGARWIDAHLEARNAPRAGTVYTPVVAFEYRTPGGPRTSTRVGRDPRDYRNLRHAEAQRLLGGAEIGRPLIAFVDPRHPERPAVLRPRASRARRSTYLAGVVSGLLVILLAIAAQSAIDAAASA